MEFLRYIVYDLGFQCFVFILICILIYTGTKFHKIIYKQICFNLSAIPIAILLFEIFSIATKPEEKVTFSGTYADNQTVSGSKIFLGYGPKEDTSFQVSAIRKNNESIIYSVNYSFKDGRRFSPNNNNTSNFNVSFLGGSHLFGDGLNDNQTTPYFLNKCSNQKYNLFNYAFSGYGTHQALMIIEKKILPALKTTKSKDAVIYYFIPSHINRAAGKTLWDVNGPQYEFINNELTYEGGFDETKVIKQNFITKRIKIIWHNSHLYRILSEGKYSNKDIIRAKEIIKHMHLLLRNNNSRFIVIVRREQNTEYLKKLLYEPMKEASIEFYFIDSIIEDYSEDNDRYHIIGDGHPSEAYNEKLAAFLHNKLIENGRN